MTHATMKTQPGEAAAVPGAGRTPRGGMCLAAVSMLALTGCLPQGLAFRVDDRLEILRPADQATVPLPVTVEWSIEDFEVVEPGSRSASGDDGAAENAGYFAVFLDTAPPPPGKPLSWVARNDNACRPQEGCPDPAYLAARGIYATTDTRIVFEQFPVPPADSKRAERHSVTVILLDPAGERIGESAYQVDFTVDRDPS